MRMKCNSTITEGKRECEYKILKVLIVLNFVRASLIVPMKYFARLWMIPGLWDWSFRSTDRWDNWCGIWCGAFTIYHIFRPTPTWVPRSQRHSCTQFNEYRRAWWIAPSAHMLNMSASITEALLHSISWVQEGVMDCSISPHVTFSFVKQNCNELSVTFNSVHIYKRVIYFSSRT